TLTGQQLNRATLLRQLLLRRERIDVADAVRQVVAVQAQEPASPYLALWNRIEGFDGASLDQAFFDREVVKASVVRITLHAVTASDYPDFYAAMLPYLRASRLNDRRFSSEGLTAADADALVPGLLALLAEPRSKAEVEAFCGPPRMWWALRTFAPLLHAPTGPPWCFGPRPSYVASHAPTNGDVAAGRAILVKRYLEGFGPASAADIGMFTMLRKPPVQQALSDLGGHIVRLEGPDGVELFDVLGGPIPPAKTKAPPRLLGMWDNVLLAYADRSRVLPDAYRPHVIRRNGDVLPTVLVDGRVAGVWRSFDDAIEVAPFHELSAATWRALTKEARCLAAFLAARDSRVYRRYDHWWDDLPKSDARRLAAPDDSWCR
ncbi:MAG TPA: winged helix DNA-binding domain-containing protein, partial [Acidimicrobiales bacterium]